MVISKIHKAKCLIILFANFLKKRIKNWIIFQKIVFIDSHNFVYHYKKYHNENYAIDIGEIKKIEIKMK